MQNHRIFSNGIMLVELDRSESHYQQGVQHGRILREWILKSIRYIRNWYCEDLGKKEGEAFIRQLQYETGYLADSKFYLPRVYEEMQGIADGCGVPVEEIFLINCLDEGFYLLLEKKGHKQPAGKCTCIGLKKTADASCRLAQNLDFSAAYNGFQTLFRSHQKDRGILRYSFCGQLMGMGLNSKGVAVIANAIANGTVSLKGGVPNTLMARAFYDCDSIEECAALLHRCPRSTSTAYTIADFHTVRCFEATVNSVVEVPIPDDASGIAHTNHLLVSKDTRNVAGVCNGSVIVKTPENVSWEMTEERLRIAQNFVSRHGKEASPERLMEFLLTPPVLREYGDPTIQSFIAVCDEADPHIYIAAGEGNRSFQKVNLYE